MLFYKKIKKVNKASTAKDSLSFSLSLTQYYLFISENVRIKFDKRSEILLQYAFNTKRIVWLEFKHKHVVQKETKQCMLREDNK